jgi:hypothetical protein
VQLFKPELHYEIVGEWWKAENWPVMPLSHLSDVGQVAYVNDVPACAGWIFQTDSKWALFEFLVANPAVRGQDRAEAFKVLLECMKMIATDFGFTNFFTSASHPSLIKRYEESGFKITDQGMTNLVFKVEA